MKRNEYIQSLRHAEVPNEVQALVGRIIREQPQRPYQNDWKRDFKINSIECSKCGLTTYFLSTTVYEYDKGNFYKRTLFFSEGGVKELIKYGQTTATDTQYDLLIDKGECTDIANDIFYLRDCRIAYGHKNNPRSTTPIKRVEFSEKEKAYLLFGGGTYLASIEKGRLKNLREKGWTPIANGIIIKTSYH